MVNRGGFAAVERACDASFDCKWEFFGTPRPVLLPISLRGRSG